MRLRRKGLMTASQAEIDPQHTRKAFPSLERLCNQQPCVFADAPGGTQVPESVIEAISSYLRRSNANRGGAFVTSAETDTLVSNARDAGAAFLGASAREIVFGPNMTTTAFGLARSLAHRVAPGDDIVVTALDHDANVAPWMILARECEANLRWVEVNLEDATLDLASLKAVLSDRTRIVAFTLASNATGTVVPASDIVALARTTGAIVIADGVHAAQHRLLDATALGVDILFTSPYKYFGPHLGMAYVRRPLIDELTPYKVRPASNEGPDRWETGTQNHEALAGLTAAVEYIAGIGRGDGSPASAGRRDEIVRGMRAIEAYEATLSSRFLSRFNSLEGVKLYGIGDEARVGERTPTFAIRLDGESPRDTATRLGKAGIFVWDGDYYAQTIMERLGLATSGGAVRIGFCHYNTADEVDRVVDELVGARP
ncbi:MAG TPA: cysteine desulfurase-like protein [Actinomycetota bacterium]|nr:cysteine desulfurase-like protein [Actinomycetota bacterium]